MGWTTLQAGTQPAVMRGAISAHLPFVSIVIASVWALTLVAFWQMRLRCGTAGSSRGRRRWQLGNGLTTALSRATQTAVCARRSGLSNGC